MDISEKIEKLVRNNYTSAAFKYKHNAEKFAKMWEKKGHYVSYIKSSGPVIDDDKHCPTAYYVIAEKEAPKPLTASEQRRVEKENQLTKLRQSDPVKYYKTYVIPQLKKYISDVDPEIRKLVIELNLNNQFTIESCAGHGNDPGLIFFLQSTFNGNVAREIMKKHGLKGIYREKELYKTPDGDRYIIYWFDPIGKSRHR